MIPVPPFPTVKAFVSVREVNDGVVVTFTVTLFEDDESVILVPAVKAETLLLNVVKSADDKNPDCEAVEVGSENTPVV